MRLTFSTSIEAADAERRIISGKVMEYGAIGQTSAGPVMFEHGSIQVPNTGKIKLLAQHEPNNPIGRAQSFSTQGDFMYGTFKISNSSKGTDYLAQHRLAERAAHGDAVTALTNIQDERSK